MAHNSFDLIDLEDGTVKAVSHNYPSVFGRGCDAPNAIDDLRQKMVYFMDNNKNEFLQGMKSRLSRGLECECGHALEDAPVGFYKGRMK